MCYIPMFPWGLTLTCSSATVYYLLGWKVEHAFASKILSRYSSLSYQTVTFSPEELFSYVIIILPSGILMWNTHNDIIYGKSGVLSNVLAYHSLGYFIFDTLSMIRIFQSKLGTASLAQVVWFRPDLAFHHFGVIFIFTPIVLYFRRGLGDFFVGMAFLMELSTPFLVLKGLLQILDLRREFSRAFLLNSMALTLTFLMVRLLPLPYAYWLFAKQSHQSLWEASTGLAWHCNLGSMALFAFQGYWFISMVRSTTRLFFQEVTSRVPASSLLGGPREKRE